MRHILMKLAIAALLNVVFIAISIPAIWLMSVPAAVVYGACVGVVSAVVAEGVVG